MKACLLSKMSIFNLRGDKRKRNGKRGGGYYAKKLIILNISVKGGDYSREAINQGTAIIQGNTVYICCS